MRKTTVTGLDDNVKLDLGSDTSPLGEVMEIGRAVDSLTYEAEMSGEQLIAFLKKFHLYEKHGDKVILKNRYLLTAYDW